MPILGKEAERQLTPDEIALREIEGYLDKVEHQTEKQPDQATGGQTNQPGLPPVPLETVKVTTPQAPPVTTTKIVLPLDQAEVQSGLGKSVADGLRWLSEWCVMMIKKYPGRVFYMPPQENKL